MLGLTVIAAVLFGIASVGSLVCYYSSLPVGLRPAASVVFALMALVLIILGFRRRGFGPWLVLLCLSGGVITSWWVLVEPSNSRDWQADVAILPWAEVNGDSVMVHNIRNVDYRSETDYTVRHYDRSFDLTTLQSVDLFLVYWGSPAIAHTMISFGFADGSFLSFSIETRKEVGESYSAVKGFFKQFELTYVVADERDIVGLRTNYRQGEEVYLYRLLVPVDFARKVLLDYLSEVNHLHKTPEWYRAIVTNCTTSILRHTTPYNPNPRFDWRFIVNGYLDEMLYERGLVDQSAPFAELKKQSHVNRQARLAGTAENFSRLIRAGLPAMEP